MSAPSEWPMVDLAKIAAACPNAITDGPFGSNLKTEHYTESGPRVIRLQILEMDFFPIAIRLTFLRSAFSD